MQLQQLVSDGRTSATGSNTKLVIERTDGTRETWSASDLRAAIQERATDLRRNLAALNVDVIALESSSSASFVINLCAARLLAVPVVPLPAAGGALPLPGAVLRRLEGVSSVLGKAHYIGSGRFRSTMATHAGTAVPPRDRFLDAAVVQFTSGSTSDPRGCLISERAIQANTEALQSALEHGDELTMLCWLPMHHDMGLFGGLVYPLQTPGAVVHLMAPDRFIRDPRSFLRLIDTTEASVSPVPSSCLRVLDRLIERLPDVSLASLRCLVVGAEPIPFVEASAFLATAERRGLRPDSFMPSYGLAETTLIATTRRGLAASTGHRGELGLSRVRLGRAVRGVELSLSEAVPLPGAPAAEILVKSASAMSGYVGASSEPAPTPLPSGDLGVLEDGELVVLGRKDDVILAAGQKIYPEDIEAHVRGQLADRGVRTVVAAATGSETSGYAIFVEAQSRESVEQLTSAIGESGWHACGVSPRFVQVHPTGTLPRTTSGKLQLRKCLELV